MMATAEVPPTTAAVKDDAPPPLPYAAMAAWNCASVVVILFNKALYSGPFPHPVTLTLLHMATNTVFTQALSAVGWLGVPQLGWSTYLRVVLALGGLFAGSLSCSNLAAARLPVATVQMLKAIAPLITVLTMFAFGTERYRHALLLVAALLTLGVGIAAAGEGARFDAIGALLQFAALVFESARMVAVQLTIQEKLPRANPLAALALFAPVSAAFLLPLSLWLEPRVLETVAGGGLPRSTLLLIGGNCAAAVALNACAVWLVSQQSGPLVMTIVGVVKDMELIVLAALTFGNHIAPMQVAGYSVALLGMNVYHVFKSPGGADLPLPQLTKTATTNATAAAMAAGIVAIWLTVAKWE